MNPELEAQIKNWLKIDSAHCHHLTVRSPYVLPYGCKNRFVWMALIIIRFIVVNVLRSKGSYGYSSELGGFSILNCFDLVVILVVYYESWLTMDN